MSRVPNVASHTHTHIQRTTRSGVAKTYLNPLPLHSDPCTSISPHFLLLKEPQPRDVRRHHTTNLPHHDRVGLDLPIPPSLFASPFVMILSRQAPNVERKNTPSHHGGSRGSDKTWARQRNIKRRRRCGSSTVSSRSLGPGSGEVKQKDSLGEESNVWVQRGPTRTTRPAGQRGRGADMQRREGSQGLSREIGTAGRWLTLDVT